MGQRWHQTNRQIYIFLWKAELESWIRYKLFVHKRIISAVNKVEFVGDRMSYITSRGRWCDIVLNIHAPTEDKTDDMKDSFYKDHMKMLFWDFNAKVGREDIFKPINGNESLHEISNDNGVRVVNFATSKNLSKVQCSHIIKFINILG
jgi:hypothetical protein